MHTFLIAPTDFGVGLTSISLGVVAALQRSGLKVGFLKPVAQTHAGNVGPEHATELITRTLAIRSPTPLTQAHVESLLSDGQLDRLLESVVALHQQAAQNVDVVVVEGMVADRNASYAAHINQHLASTLDAQVILVAAPADETLAQLIDRLEMQVHQFDSLQPGSVIGAIINKVRAEDGPDAFAERLHASTALFAHDRLRLMACIGWQPELNAPRTHDIAERLGAHWINTGAAASRRVSHTVLAAGALRSNLELLKPGALVLSPADRDDTLLAASLTTLNGVPLAGIVLCGEQTPEPALSALCQPALTGGLPVLQVPYSALEAAQRMQSLPRDIPLEDRELAQRVAEYIAGHLDHEWLRTRCASVSERRLSPAAFRYQLTQRAQATQKCIVLPEGHEPRTIEAAALCQARGIARCILLAAPAQVQATAQALGIELPEGLQVIDPQLVRERYVEPLVKLRQGKGLTAPAAQAQLEDPIVLGTVMLALDEVDGLVAGAINTTANTIRPALQLIKTAPGYQLVSSVFFMLLPDQVLVYGDCAVNPDPNAAQLAEIALQSAASAEAFGITPRVAMISYSTGASGSGAQVDKVRQATELVRSKRPDLAVDGPLQYDAAAVLSVGQQKAPHSSVAGRATVFVFPDLNTGNTTYKAVQRSADCLSVGPMLQGLRKPVNDLSRGASVEDIVYTIALTAVQAASGSTHAPTQNDNP